MLSCHSVYGSRQRNIHCWLLSSKVLRCGFRSASRAFCFLYIKRNLACASFLSSSLHSSKTNKARCGQWVTVIHKPCLCPKLLLGKPCWRQYLLKAPFYISALWKSQGVQQGTSNFLLVWLFRYRSFTGKSSGLAPKGTSHRYIPTSAAGPL